MFLVIECFVELDLAKHFGDFELLTVPDIFGKSLVHRFLLGSHTSELHRLGEEGFVQLNVGRHVRSFAQEDVQVKSDLRFVSAVGFGNLSLRPLCGWHRGQTVQRFTSLNFLAHLYLAEPTDESLVGNLLGDFAKGLPVTLEKRFPQAVVRGILQHRAVDAFTDAHPTFSQARRLLSPHRTRLAGIVVDVFYDYFLSTRWPGGDEARQEFIDRCHQTLLAHDEWLSPQLRAVLPRMISENWLGSYSSIGGLALTFRRVATRSPVAAGVLAAEEDFVKNREELEMLYDEFFPDLENFSRQWLKDRD